jgi:hypothetical protein
VVELRFELVWTMWPLMAPAGPSEFELPVEIRDELRKGARVA